MTFDLSTLEADLSTAPPPGTMCAVQKIVAEHPEAEATIRAAISDQSRSASRVAMILTRNGLKISETSIKRHRQGACARCKGDSQ